MDDRSELFFEAVSIKGNTGYASAYRKNGLYRVNINTGESVFVRNFDEMIYLGRLHSSVVRIQDKLFFVPAVGDNISIFDIKDESMKTVRVPGVAREKYPFYNGRYKFIDAVNYNNGLWLIPSSYPGILRLDLTTYSIDIFDAWIPEDGYFFRSKPVIDGQSIIIPSGNNNILLKFDLKTQKAVVTKLGENNRGIMCMIKVGANYICAPRIPGPIVSWNPSNNIVKEYNGFPDTFVAEALVSEASVFAHMYQHDGKLYFVPGKASRGVIFENGIIREDTENNWKMHQNSLIEFLFETNTDYYYREIVPSKSFFFKVKKSSGERTDFEFSVVNRNKERIMSISSAKKTGEILYESFNLALRDLLIYLNDNE